MKDVYILKNLLKYATEYYSARAKAEKYYHDQKERLSDLMCHSDIGEEYQKINDTYRTLKMEELSAWENYYPLLNMFGYEYESTIKSMLRFLRH